MLSLSLVQDLWPERPACKSLTPTPVREWIWEGQVGNVKQTGFQRMGNGGSEKLAATKYPKLKGDSIAI